MSNTMNMNNLNILDSKLVPINQDFVITLTKENCNSIDQRTRNICKILVFSVDWEFNDILYTISRLDSKSYPYLFIFVIKVKCLGFSNSNQNPLPEKVESLLKLIPKFFEQRSLILQLTSNDENVTKIYYKDENCLNFKLVEENLNEDFKDFLTFLIYFLNGKFQDFENQIIEKLPNLENSSLVLKFLNTLDIYGDFYNNLVLKCAARCKSSDLLAITDGFINDDGNIQDNFLKYFLWNKIGETSVLHAAIKNTNDDIIKFLIKYCSEFIQQLEFDHQIEVSTLAFTTNQIDVLCNLIQICDFPFPRDFKPESVKDESLSKIIDSRQKFHNDILNEDRAKIENFAKSHPNLKFAYDLKNKSAFCQALDSKKYSAFYKLKALRFQDQLIKYSKIDCADDRKIASKSAGLQRNENVNNSILKDQTPISLLSMRSFIYQRDNNNAAEEYEAKIKEWYKQIYSNKFGSKLIDAAAQCDKLKIIYDFECDSVKNVDVTATSASMGTTHPGLKYIFIGAKLTDQDYCEQKIKGVIIHEICHYVMRLVYQNNENPYYKGDTKTKNEFKEIVAAIKDMLVPSKSTEEIPKNDDESKQKNDFQIVAKPNETESECKPNDDQCEGIISTVITLYEEVDWHPEMIVRPAHILAQFENDAEKIRVLENKYKKLFEFCEKIVIPEVEKFNLEHQEQAKNFNNLLELLPMLKSSKIELLKHADLSELLKNQIGIIISNVPRILMINIYKHQYELYGELYNAKNIFISQKSLENSFTRKSFEVLLTQNINLNIFIDCLIDLSELFKLLPLIRESKLFFIVSSKKQSDELTNYYKTKNLQPTIITLNYNWLDLTLKSHKNLLQKKVNFQNNSKLALSDLILSDSDHKDEQFYKTEEFANLIDDQNLNLLVEDSEILLNSHKSEDILDKNFEILFQTRILVKKFTVLEPVKVSNDLENEKQGKFSVLKFFKQKTTEYKTLSRQKSVQATEINDENEVECEAPNEPEVKYEKVQKSVNISQDQIIEDVKNQKYILISDKAGSGKSWAMKNLMSILLLKCPKKWTVYVDLKQYIKKFKKQKCKLNFVNFMVQNIMKFKSKFEEETFKMLYKNGKVNILFDGFDEIAPDCAEFVTKLFQSFEQNGENQLWIATRDYFEVDLKKELNIDVVYKLDEFTEDHGVDLIASCWMLSEISPEFTQKPKTKILKHIKSLSNFKNYLKIARRINKKLSRSQTTTIGSPQFYKMISDILRSNKKSAINLTTFKVFDECVNIQYERWSQEKGELRLNANTESQNKGLNFHKLHQLVAMKGLYPDESEFCDLNFEDFDWSDEEVIACGLLCKVGDDFYFFHETYREYHVAKFVIRILTKPKFEESICKYLNDFLYHDKFGIVRMFLNEAFGETSFCKIIDAKVPKIANFFDDYDLKICNLTMIVKENLQNLVDFVIKILKCRTYERTKEFIWENEKALEVAINSKKLFIKIQDFIIDFLNENDLKVFLSEKLIVTKILRTNLDRKTTEFFIRKLINKLDSKFIAELLLSKNNDKDSFFHSILSEKGSDFKFKKALQIVDTFVGSDVIIELAKQCNNDGDNFFYVCFKKKELNKLDDLFAKFKEFVVSGTSVQQIKELLVQNMPGISFNLIQISGCVESVKFQNDFWFILRIIFENRDELKNILTAGIKVEVDKDDENFTAYFTFSLFALTEDLFDIILNHMQQTFNKIQFEEILGTTIKIEGNLLMWILNDPENYKISFQYSWKFLRNCCKSNEEFIEYLKRVDNNGYNVFHYVVFKSTREIFDFMIKDLEEFATKNEIRNLLNSPGKDNINLLHVAVICDVTFEFYEILWKKIQKYFDPLEIIEMIVATDEEGNDLVLYTIENQTREIVDRLWNEIKQVLLTSGYFEGELSELWNECFVNLMKFLEDKTDEESKKAFSDKWQIVINKFRALYSLKLFEQTTSSDVPITDYKVLHKLAPCDSLIHHSKLWEKLLISYPNKDEIKDLILQQDSNKNNFMHHLLKNSIFDVIKFTFSILKKNLNYLQFSEVIRSKGEFSRNLLQAAIAHLKYIEFVQYLWQTILDSVSHADLNQIVFEEVDIEKKNTIYYIACHATSEILEFVFNELEKIITREELKDLIKFSENTNTSFVWLSVKNNKSLNFHKILWKIIKKYLSTSEVLDMMNKIFIIFAVRNSSSEIAKLIWNEFAGVINSDNYLKDKLLKYLNQCQLNFINLMNNSVDENAIETMIIAWNDLVANFKIFESYTLVEKILNQEVSVRDFKVLHKLALCKKIEFHEAFWQILLEIIGTKEELKDLILKKNKKGNNFLHHLLLVNNKDEIIKFTFIVLKNFMLQENLELIEKKEKSFLYRLQCNIKNSLPFQKLKKKYSKTLSKRNEEFLKILKEVNSEDRNFFHIAARFSSSEIVEFIFDELEAIGTNGEIKEILQITGYWNGNLLHEATCSNKSVKVHEKLWQIITKYLKNSEILDFVKHKDDDGDNIFHNVVYWNEIDVVKLTWNQIINFIEKKEDQIEYLKTRGHYEEHLIKMSFENKSNDKEVLVWIDNLIFN